MQNSFRTAPGSLFYVISPKPHHTALKKTFGTIRLKTFETFVIVNVQLFLFFRLDNF